MSVQQIGNLNIEMQNVLPAQTLAPVEPPPPPPPPEEQNMPSELPTDIAEARSRMGNGYVDTYA